MPRTQKLPDVYNKEQLVSLANKIDQPRMMIAMILGFFLGLRSGEVIRLKKSDFDFVNKRVKVINSKNPCRSKQGGYGKDRYVAILHDGIIPLLIKYMDGIETEYLFAPKFNKSKNTHIDHATFSELFQTYLKNAGLLIPIKKLSNGNTQYKFRFHTLRHTVATLMLDKGLELRYIQTFLGHNDIKTTTIYTHVSTEDVQKKGNGIFERQIERRQRRSSPFSNNGECDPLVEIDKLRVELERMKVENQRVMMGQLFSGTKE